MTDLHSERFFLHLQSIDDELLNELLAVVEKRIGKLWSCDCFV